MKKEVIIVPKDKCPLDVLADMGEKLLGVGILFSITSLNKLRGTADRYEKLDPTAYLLSWNATKDFPQTTLIVVGEYSSDSSAYEYRATYINADDICFRTQWDDRALDYFLTMEE